MNILDKQNSMRKILSKILEEYRLSNIQSEAEVRSKLIVPLIEYLGYPSYLRSEEFPVYGWEGRKQIPTKNADFLLFSSKDFANKRARKADDLKWVQDHSLLVFEAKKPGEMPDFDGQAIYYTQWTKAVAYMASDGEEIRGCYYSKISSDMEYVNCKIDDLVNASLLEQFEYEKILAVKMQFDTGKVDNTNPIAIISSDNIETINEDEIKLPDETINYMSEALHVTDKSISNYELVRRFLKTTDTILDCELRYDIPVYAFDLPREACEAKVYLNKMLFPTFVGQVEHFYWNDYDRYQFSNDYIEIIVLLEKEKVVNLAMGYKVLDRQSTQRLSHLQQVRKCYLAHYMDLELDNGMHVIIDFNNGEYVPTDEFIQNGEFTAYWIEEISKIIEIESVYGIELNLKKIDGIDDINRLYDAVDNVYDGICGKCNCEITLPESLVEEPIIIEEPTFFEEKDLPLEDKYIHDICFRPCASMLLPGTIDKKKAENGIVRADACCAYRIVEG